MISDPIEVKILDSRATLPKRAHEHDAAFDLYVLDEAILGPGEKATLSTGLAIAVPYACVGLLVPRSGLATKHGVTLANSVGVIDHGYSGTIQVCLINTDQHKSFTINSGDRVAQLMIVPIVINTELTEVNEFSKRSLRGSSGFGSTGLQEIGQNPL